MIVTIGGSAGSGTSTLAKEIASRFGLKHISAGLIMREMAKEKGMDLLEFSKFAEENSQIDNEIDEGQKKMADGNCVAEGRLSAHFLEHDISVWLTAPLDVRATRVSYRENISPKEAEKRITEREASEKKRYKEFYDIDISDMDRYDIILNTGKFDIDSMVKIVSSVIESLSDK
ncbi:MAG: AAA family ATPase [Candidatus Altiarchaeota archaeon]|nr:AAA family ATPase [Candidatus Altiarchaeota archaeon]